MGGEGDSPRKPLYVTEVDANAQDTFTKMLQALRGRLGVDKRSLAADVGPFGDLHVTGSRDFITLQFDSEIAQNLALTTATGSGTVSQNGAKAIMAINGTPGLAMIRSANRVPYFPGHGFGFFWTQHFEDMDANVQAYAGPNDGNNGFRMGWDGTVGDYVAERLRAGSVEEQVTRANWNGDYQDAVELSGDTHVWDPTQSYAYRFIGGLLGNAPVYLQVRLPTDWYTLHAFEIPGTLQTGATDEFDMPMLMRIERLAGTGVAKLETSSWRGSAFVFQQDRIDRPNSTTTPLLAGQSFNGTDWFSTLGLAEVRVNVQSDVASAAGGVRLQHSLDGGTTPLDAFAATYAQVGDLQTFTFPATGGSLGRICYQNSATDQGYIFLETILSEKPSAPQTQRIDSVLTDRSQGSVHITTLQGFKTGTGWQKVGTDLDGPAINVALKESIAELMAAGLTLGKSRSGSVGSGASVRADTSPLANRKAIVFWVNTTSNKGLNINFGASATSANGNLNAGQGFAAPLTEAQSIHVRGVGGTSSYSLLEFGGTP